jgi:hypothetical protein
MRIDLTEIESLEIINVVLKEKLAEQQLSFDREKKEILFKRLIEKYGIKGKAELSEDGRALILPDIVQEEIKVESPQSLPAKAKHNRKKV